MKNLAAAILLIFPSPCLANDQCMDTATSDEEIEKCASQELDQAESSVDAIYKATLAELDRLISNGDKGSAEAKKQLIDSQKKWSDFRKSDCDIVFYLNIDGSIRIPETMNCMANHANRRSELLKHLFD